jgi:prevent-host-death family protein
MEIGIREFKNRLSEILQRANQGEQITITNHGQAICLLSPVKVEEIKRSEFLERAIALGWVTPATRASLGKSTPIKPRKAGPTTTQILMESRREHSF